jgi:single-stranded-DNA-specific exonuclease
MIAVYGDYDVDGVTATALMVATLRALGGKVTAYIPHRVDDGYGLNNDSLDLLKQQGVSVVLSVDCGVRATGEAEHARAVGLDLLISDHHAVPPQLPSAPIINPKQPGCPYPFKELSGAGIAYKIAEALLTADQRAPINSHSLLDLAALGTVADVVPLRGENRSMVYQGLKLLNNAPRIGIRELILKAGFRLGQVDSAAIGFGLGPRLNAAGRMEHARSAYELLMSDDRAQAERLAGQLDAVNRERQELTKQCVARAREQVVAQQQSSLLAFAADPGYPQGVVGLIAGRLADEFYRPALVIEQGPELSKGSARTIPEFNIIEALDECADLLEKYGGHSAAAGFSVRTARLADLHARLDVIAHRRFDGQVITPTIYADAEVTFKELDRSLLYLLEQMEPFGAGNPSPLFVARRTGVRSHRPIGKEGEHLRLHLVQKGTVREAIAFRQGKPWAGRIPQLVDVAFAFEWNEFNGLKGMQLNIKDIKASDASGAQATGV